MIQQFQNMIKIGGVITLDHNSKKKFNFLPHNWTSLSTSIYNNEENYAILTGSINNIIVIDLDKKNDDFIALQWFEKNINILQNTNTLVTRTINGGYHIFYRYTPDLIGKKIPNLNIDILSDKSCCFQGKNYDVLYDNPINQLTPQQIHNIQSSINIKKHTESKNKDNEPKNLVKKYKNINLICNIPHETQWNILVENNGYKAVPQCKYCLINPSKEHSQIEHSSLYINKDMSVVKTCYSCGVKVLDKKDSKKIINYLNIIVENQETNVYNQLTSELLDYTHNLYKRQKHTGIVYKQIKPYAYIKYMEPIDFLNDIFKDDNLFKSNVNNIDNLIKYMKQYNHSKFPFIEYNNDYIGFSNGVLNKITCEFINIPSNNITVKKYFDYDFDYSTSTPLIDKILLYQFDQETTNFIYACLGRMFGIQDNLGFMLYLNGEAGCGKSLIIDILCECFDNIGAISNTFEEKFGLSFLYNKDIVVCDDLPKNISKIFPQQVFQTCVTNGKVGIAIKGGESFSIDWKVPMIWAGNWYPDYIDKGQISRRMLIANFNKIVNQPDPSLKERIIKHELPAFIYKCLLLYKDLVNNSIGKSIYNICPDYFKEQQEELKIERNPLYKFLIDNTKYEKDHIILMEDIRSKFNEWIGKKITKLDHGTFLQVDNKYEIISLKICKHCNNESIKGCCFNYKHSDRTLKVSVRNISWFLNDLEN